MPTKDRPAATASVGRAGILAWSVSGESAVTDPKRLQDTLAATQVALFSSVGGPQHDVNYQDAPE